MTDKYDIDDLVNSLLMERQPDLPLVAPDLDVAEAEEPDNPYIMDFEDMPAMDEEEAPEQDVVLIDEVMEKAPAQADMPQTAKKAPPTPVPEEAPIAEDKSEAVAIPETMPVVLPTAKEKESPIEAAEAPVVASVPVVAAAASVPPKKKKKFFTRKMEDTGAVEQNWVDWGLQPIGHYKSKGAVAPTEPKIEPLTPVEPPAPAVPTPSEKKGGTIDEFPAVKAVAETITMQVVLPSGVALPKGEEHTRIIPDAAVPAEAPKATPKIEVAEPEPSDQLPDQLSLEEMVRVEDIEPSADSPAEQEEWEDPEERLQRAREEKVREFTLSGEEEEENEPEDEPAEEEQIAEIEDFTGYNDTEAVATELKYRCRSSLLALLFIGILELALLFLTLLTEMVGNAPMPETGYVIVHMFGLVTMMGLSYSTITRGLSGLFSLKANNDSAPAVVSAVCLVNLFAHLLDPSGPMPYWTPLAGLLLVLSAAAHYAQEVCVRRNFAFVSHPSDKYAAAVIEEEGALQEIGRRAVSSGEATVAYFRRTGFLSDYLTNAYDEDRGDEWSRWMTPIALVASLLISLLTLTGETVSGVMEWLDVWCGMVCLAMPVTLLAVQMPLSGCCKRMLSRGGFLNGWQAVRTFGQPDALVVDIADLYPDESMLLHGIKTFSGAHIDEVILMAASLAVRSGGPLSMIFRRIIENKDELLYDVDSLVYEQGMGLSGWVDGRRVFVGNGRLLQNHGVDVPSADYEARYAKDGRRLLYVSVAGQLSAMFVVSYLPDPEIQAALQDLCRARVTLLVRSCDPNITTSDLCESFELDEYYVDVLPAAAGRMYVQLTEQETESLPAVMASNGHILGTARVLSACRRMQVKVTAALIVQMIVAILGVALCFLLTLNGSIAIFQPLLLLLGSLFFTWFIPLFCRG